MYRKYLTSILLIIFTGASTVVLAKNQDAGLWTTLSIEKKITNKFSASIDEEVRFFNNITQLNLLYTNFGLNYKINKYIKVSATYRLIEKTRPGDYFSIRHRFYGDLSFRYKINPLIFVFRTRLQTQYRDYYSSELGKYPETYSRNKLDIKLDLNKKIAPFVAAEIRYMINNPRYPSGENMFDRIRYIFGFDYEINKRNSLTLYYLIQQEYNVDYDPEQNFNLGIAYGYSF